MSCNMIYAMIQFGGLVFFFASPFFVNICLLWEHFMYSLCPPNPEGGGYIDFGADPVSVHFYFPALSSEPVDGF